MIYIGIRAPLSDRCFMHTPCQGIGYSCRICNHNESL